MMNIRDYFRKVRETESMEDASEYEHTIYECYNEDEDDFESWAIENGIDLEATTTVLGDEILVLTLWVWDMCGE